MESEVPRFGFEQPVKGYAIMVTERANNPLARLRAA